MTYYYYYIIIIKYYYYYKKTFLILLFKIFNELFNGPLFVANSPLSC